MTTVSRIPLSGSTNGRGIKVAATSSPGTTVHTCSSTTNAGEGEWVYLSIGNNDTVTRRAIIEMGGTTDIDDTHKIDIPPIGSGLVRLDPFWLRSTLVVKVYCATADVLTVFGWADKVA